MNKSILTPVALATLIASATLSAQSPYTTDANTILLYHFDEASGSNVTDSSGNGRNGTRLNPNTAGGSGQTGMGYAESPQARLPGDNTSYRITWADPSIPTDPGAILYPLGVQEFTIEMWVNFSNFDFSDNRLLLAIQADGSVSADLSFSVRRDGDNIYFAVGDSGGVNRSWTYGAPLSVAGENPAVNSNEWYHIAVTATPNVANPAQSIFRFYFNRPGDLTSPTPIFTDTIANLVPTASGDFRTLSVGNYYGNNGDSFFLGMIDELRISNIARTSFDTLQPIPEPSQIAFLLFGSGLLVGLHRKRFK